MMPVCVQPNDLRTLPSATLHALEYLDGQLRHSAGVRALGTLKVLSSLAADRMDKPGFREKLDAARADAGATSRQCRDFFSHELPNGTRIGELFPGCCMRALSDLAALPALPVESVPEVAQRVLDSLGTVTQQIQAARRSIEEVVRQQVPGLAALCEAAGARFVTSLADLGDAELFVNPARLGDALQELMGNALKHGFKNGGGTVRLELASGKAPNEIAIAVVDDGEGIDEAVRSRLFERGITTGGTGEGLAMVREVVQTEHLGRLTYATGSTGTRWEIVLPVRVSPEHLPGLAPPTESPPTGGPSGGPIHSAVRVVSVALALVGLGLLGLGIANWLMGTGSKAASATVSYEFPDNLPRETVDPATGIHLVLVPAGEFVMGSDRRDTSEAPAHRVRITRHFYLSATEVTQEQYERIMGENPSRRKGAPLPVEQVSFVDAWQFCAKAGFRLPTEAEWEYAALTSSLPLAGSSRPVHVGQGTANALGLRGMLGNIAEWCDDRYGLYSAEEATDPTGPKRGNQRVVRGGSYLTAREQLRPTLREALDPMSRRDFVGFRVVRDVANIKPDE